MSLPRRLLSRARNPSITYLCQAVGPAVGVTEPSELVGSNKKNYNPMSQSPQRPGQFNPLHPGMAATLYSTNKGTRPSAGHAY